jgi:hypothetical protein
MVLASVGSGAEVLRQGERDFAMSSLHATRKFFLDSIAGLSPEQANFKPAPDRWSIAECAEHIALSETFIADRIKESLKGPQESEIVRAEQARKKDQQIIAMVPDRSQRFPAPEPLQPKRKFSSLNQAADYFRQHRDTHISYVRTTTDDLRAHSSPHPALGKLDAYQWYLLISAHTERHTHQILEVKADPNFPKK